VARALEGPAQLFVEPPDLQSSGLGLLRATTRARRELPGDDGREEEGRERDPVLRLGDVQGAERREEEEVEAAMKSTASRSASATVVELTPPPSSLSAAVNAAMTAAART
jgi:hypothetical protein